MEIVCCLPGVTGHKNAFIDATGLIAKKEVIHTKHFYHPSFSISLRPFCIPRDMPAVYNWAWKLSRSPNMVATSYLYAGHSDFARSFMALLNNRLPLCQIDVCLAEKDELYECYHAKPGDYIIRMLMNTSKKRLRPLHVYALRTSLEYFFLFPEIKRIVAHPETDNNLFHEILYKSGFQFEEHIYDHYSLSSVFACNRTHLNG